jgi:NTE family protein
MEEHRADAVFQGGGVKGLALTGALEEFSDFKRHPKNYVEEWVQLAGTSAGAIVAAYLACGNDSKQTSELIQKTDFAEFQDWGPGGKVIGGVLNLVHHHGLAHGNVFLEWFRKAIDNQTFGDIEKSGRVLKLIATDITRGEMLVLPDDLHKYRHPSDGNPLVASDFPIAEAVRMSMSIPFFFQPIELVRCETGEPSTIVDGGVLSNFPVWIFDVEDRDPKRPTFGFKLIDGKGVGGALEGFIKAFGWPARMGVDIFHTTSEAWDRYWVSHATMVRTCAISAGTIATTQFDLGEPEKQWLLNSGKTKAAEFLDAWSPESYLNSDGRKLT